MTTDDIVTETLAALGALEGVWDEEEVDELDHARQTAVRARELRPDDDAFVVAALLHDVSRSPLVAAALHGADGADGAHGPDHAAAAQAWLTPRYGERVGWLAGSHVAAKRYLAAHDPGYALSPTSVRTLAAQGGPRAVEERAAHPWWTDALVLRRCDDAAKVPGAAVPGLDELRPLLARVAAR